MGAHGLVWVLLMVMLQGWVAHAVNITVGYLMADKSQGFVKNKQGRIISGAMSYAVEQINKDPGLLAGHRLVFMWADTNADTLNGTRALTDLWRAGAVAFFGPEDSCDVEARVAASWNLPMISYKCADHKVSDKELYPTFARTFPPAIQVTRSIIALLTHFNWRKFTIVVGSVSKWQSIAEKLQDMAKQYNYTINDRFDFEEPHVPETKGNPFPTIVSKSYIDTRVYVFLGEHNAMVDMVSNLQDRGLLDSGEYVVIHTDTDTFTNIDPLKYFRRTYDKPTTNRNEIGARALLAIVASPPSNPEYSHFHEIVDDHNKAPPFGFPNPFGFPKMITVYGAYLYDSVFLYARALDEHLKANGSLIDGRGIIARIKGKSYRSIQGFLSYIDENGDAEGNYTVLARRPFLSAHGNYSMLPVGHFQIGHNQSDLPTVSLLDAGYIDWIRGSPPLDEPPCGYRGEYCITPPNYTLQITCGILGGILLIVIIVILIIYRNWRYEQEIAGLLWRINVVDIQGLNQGATNAFGSRITITTHGSVDSRITLAQIFTKTGTYKGQVIALKKYTKRNLDITRSMKKEMKIMRDLRHDNVNAFVGACVDPPHFIIVNEYCSKGSLQDILENDDVKLDSMFIASLVMDLLKGMIFLHDSELHVHGNLKSSNCVVNSRWSLQVADFGLLELRAQTDYGDNEHAKFRNLLWTAPELLRESGRTRQASQKGDVYAFGIILYEIIGRIGPYGDCELSPKEIVENVALPGWKVGMPSFRPDISVLECQDYLLNCMQDCWAEIPESRPDFLSIRSRMKPLRAGMKTNIFDNMVEMMEKYQTNLEDLVAERTDQLMDEKKKTESLLHRMLPKSVADQLLQGQAVLPETFKSVTIYFSDICGFTALSASSTPMQVVDLLNDLYTVFDSIIRNYDVYKVETIGDAYMVVSGLPLRNEDNHAGEIASMSLHLLTAIKTFKIRHKPQEIIKLRIGIHTGSCVCGVVGLTMPRYCLFGDTVNTASRMESNGEALKIHVSPDCYALLEKLGGYYLEPRGKVAMKGKGEIYTYWLVDEDSSVRQYRMEEFYKTRNRSSETPECGCSSPETRKNRQLTPSQPGVESPRSRHKSAKDKKYLDNATFYELMRDPENTSLRSQSRGPSFRRRRSSYDGRPTSRDYSMVNGCLPNRQRETTRSESRECVPLPPLPQQPLRTPPKPPHAKDYTPLPSIIVDRAGELERGSPGERDSLLDKDRDTVQSPTEGTPGKLQDFQGSELPNDKSGYTNGDHVMGDHVTGDDHVNGDHLNGDHMPLSYTRSEPCQQSEVTVAGCPTLPRRPLQEESFI